MSWFYESGNELKQYTNTGAPVLPRPTQKTNRTEQATDGLGVPMTLSEEYHRLIRCINTNAWKLNKKLTEMSLFCLPQCNWFLLCLKVSNYAIFNLFHHQFVRLWVWSKLNPTSTVWIQCFRVLSKNSTVGCHVWPWESNWFQISPLVGRTVMGWMLAFPPQLDRPDSYVEATPKWWCLEVGPLR